MCKLKYYLAWVLLFLLSLTNVYAAAPTRPSGSVAVAHTTAAAANYNADLNTIYNYLQAGVDTFSAGSIDNTAISATAGISYSKLSLSNSIKSTDIASGGTLLPTGAVFFMLTGSCPSGTTDITATYSNKFIKINATQATTSGVVLTGTTDSHALTQAELPSFSMSLQIDGSTVGAKSAGGDGPNFGTSANGGNSHTATAISGGSGSGHTHTISSATTLEPASVTMKLCQCN